jgi:CheY-like chemotaxis protein
MSQVARRAGIARLAYTGGGMKRILIADDNTDFAESLKLVLEASGYQVALAGNGNEAISAQVVFSADVLITDLVMPEQDGFETLQLFRREFPNTRVVVVSGAQRLEPGPYLNAAALIGADATFRKPFPVEALLEKLREL